MKKTFITLFLLLLLFTLSGCNKGFKSPEELGETHFKLYFDVLQAEDVDVTKQCTQIYAADFISYCENIMADLDEYLEIRVLTEDDFELYGVTSETMENTTKEMRNLTDYDVVYKVTISYGVSLGIEATILVEEEYTMFVVEIDGEYKAVLSNFQD